MGIQYTILAAGMGERLGTVTDHKPKPLVSVTEERALLEAQLDVASNVDAVDRFVVVTGYRRRQVEAAVDDHDVSAETRCVFNPCFDIAGPLVSAWSGVGFHDGDIALVNGDTLYRRTCYATADEVDEGIHLLSSTRDTFEPDDVRLRTDGGTVTAVGKGLEDADAASAGFLVVRGDDPRRSFDQALTSLLESEDYLRTGTWHSVVDSLAEKGISVRAREVPDDSWVEVDTEDDLQRARRWLADNGLVH